MSLLKRLLKEQRVVVGLTQKEVGRKLKIHPQFISNLERGTTPLPTRYVRKYAKILGIKPTAIVGAMFADYARDLCSKTKVSEF